MPINIIHNPILKLKMNYGTLVLTLLASGTIYSPTAYAQEQENPTLASNVLDFGADPTGAINSTAAFEAALISSPSIFLPCGNYLVNLDIIGKTNVTITGAGTCTTLHSNSDNKSVLNIVGTNFSEFRNFSVAGSATGKSSGIVIARSSNTEFTNLYVAKFAMNGLECKGQSPDGSSGIRVKGGYYLENGYAGISYDECQDFLITGTNLGKNRKFGLSIRSSNAGQVENNYIWENGSAIGGEMISYDWFTSNRLTQSEKEGFSCKNCNFLTITGNQSYNNSKSSIGGYEDWKFSEVRSSIFANNMIYDWTGKKNTNHSITIDKNSSDILISNNIFSYNVFSSIKKDPLSKKIIIRNNIE